MKNLRLNKMAKNELSRKEMQTLTGGQIPGMCGCGCAYAGSGGSSAMDNGLANADHGYWTGRAFICAETIKCEV